MLDVTFSPSPRPPAPPPRNATLFTRTWNPLRRFCPLLPAWWAHIKNQRILNDYITAIVRDRWDIIQKEKSKAAGANGVSHVNGGDGAGGRKRDILDKVLDSLEPGEWGSAAVMQVRANGALRRNP